MRASPVAVQLMTRHCTAAQCNAMQRSPSLSLCRPATVCGPDGRVGTPCGAPPARHPNLQPPPSLTLPLTLLPPGVDNGRIWFYNVRVDRHALLDAYASVDAAGVYRSPIPSISQRFGTMVGGLTTGRLLIGQGAVDACKIGLTIAVRYSCARPQFGDKLIMSYLTQQRRLLPGIALTYAMQMAMGTLKVRQAQALYWLAPWGRADSRQAGSQAARRTSAAARTCCPTLLDAPLLTHALLRLYACFDCSTSCLHTASCAHTHTYTHTCTYTHVRRT